MLGIEVLVVFLSAMESGQSGDLGDDRIAPELLCPSDGRLKSCLLLSVNVEHRGTVLGADVVTLPVEGGRIVRDKEQVEDHFLGNDGFVKTNSHHLGVSGNSRAHRIVVGMAGVASGVAGNNLGDAAGLLVDGVQAPEAPAA